MELPEWLAAEVAAGKVTKKQSRFRGSQGATTRVQWLCTCGWTLPDGAGEGVYERHHKTAVAHRREGGVRVVVTRFNTNLVVGARVAPTTRLRQPSTNEFARLPNLDMLVA